MTCRCESYYNYMCDECRELAKSATTPPARKASEMGSFDIVWPRCFICHKEEADLSTMEKAHSECVNELRAKLAAAEKTIHTLAEQMISDAEYTAKLLDHRFDASNMKAGQMAIKAIGELKKGK